MNTILLFLSKDRLSDDGTLPAEHFYKYGAKSYRGIQTNDAPVRALMDLKDRIDQIIAITTKEVQNDKVVNDMTTLERFELMVGDEAGLHGYDAPRIITVPYDNTEIEDARKSALRIYRDITKYLDDSKEHQVMIDFTGGMRDVNFLMTTIIRYLQVAGISCDKIVYSNQNPPRIVNLNYIYDMFQQVNAVNEFVTTGNAAELRKVYKNSVKAIRNVIESIQNFSDTVLMCNSGHIDDAINRLTKAVNVEIDDDTFESGLFKTLIPIIRRKMYLESGRMEYPDLIRWCLDNRMIQQAVTFYIEKMPVYYFEKDKEREHPLYQKYLQEAKEKPSSLASSPETQAFYINIFDHYTEDQNITMFMQAVKNITASCDKDADDRKVIEEVIKEKSELDDPMIRNALSRLEEIVRKRYIDKHNISIYGVFPNQSDARRFINALITNGSWQHFFVYDDKEDYETRKNAGTYMKKAMAIERYQEQSENREDSLLLRRMKYYLAVKLLRNHMNHAIGTQGTADSKNDVGERYAIDVLNKAGITENIGNPSVDEVMQIIREGIDLEKGGTGNE